MQNRILLVITIVLSLILVTLSSSENTTFFNSEPNITIKNSKTDAIDSLNLEEYIIGVVAAEMPASFNEEALKAQAIASRTYATYKMQSSPEEYDVVTDVTDQSYITIDEMKNKWNSEFDKYYEKVSNAVMATKGKVMYYLQSVESTYDNSNLKNFEVTKEFTKEEICQKLDLSCNTLTFTNIERSTTNRVNSITVNEVEYKGTTFRTKLGLRSTDFTVTESNNKILITTKGYGHGVGMSQYGANGMANA